VKGQGSGSLVRVGGDGCLDVGLDGAGHAAHGARGLLLHGLVGGHGARYMLHPCSGALGSFKSRSLCDCGNEHLCVSRGGCGGVGVAG